MRLTLRRRLTLGIWAASAALLAAGGALAHRYFEKELVETLDRGLRARAVAAIHALCDPDGTPEVLDRILRTPAFSDALPLRGVLQGDAAGAAPSASLPVGEKAAERIWTAARAARPGAPFDVDLSNDRALRCVAIEAPDTRGARARVVVFEEIEEVREVLARLDRGLAALLVLAGVGALFASRVVAPWVDRPLRAITRAARDAEAGRRPIEVPGDGDETIDALSRTVESAFRRLDALAERESRFAAHAAHELRTPIAALIAHAEVALRRERPSAEYRAALEECLAAARRLGELVEALVALARPGAETSGVPSGCDAADSVRAVAAEFDAPARAAGASVVVRAAAPAPVSVSGEHMAIILRNLVGNAIRHARGAREIVVAAERAAEGVRLRVADDGAGVPTELVEDAGSPFVRGDASRSRATGGFGLGLSIVRRIVESHGGTMTLRSAPGAGTVVELLLPHPPPAPVRRAEEPSADAR